MSDPATPEPVVATTPAAATAPATPAPAVEAPVVVVEKKKGRAVGVWSFILGLLAVLGDLALIIFAIITAFTAFSAITSGGTPDSGEFLAALAAFAAGFGVAGLVVFFGGFVVAGLGALLGLIAIFTGRGRVIGVFGFLLSAAALGSRIALITSGLNLTALNGG